MAASAPPITRQCLDLLRIAVPGSIELAAESVAKLPTGDDAELTEDLLQVVLDGVGGDEEPVSDFLVRVADAQAQIASLQAGKPAEG